VPILLAGMRWLDVQGAFKMEEECPSGLAVNFYSSKYGLTKAVIIVETGVATLEKYSCLVDKYSSLLLAVIEILVK
jgi:hypothetical protein